MTQEAESNGFKLKPGQKDYTHETYEYLLIPGYDRILKIFYPDI